MLARRHAAVFHEATMPLLRCFSLRFAFADLMPAAAALLLIDTRYAMPPPLRCCFSLMFSPLLRHTISLRRHYFHYAYVISLRHDGRDAMRCHYSDADDVTRLALRCRHDAIDAAAAFSYADTDSRRAADTISARYMMILRHDAICYMALCCFISMLLRFDYFAADAAIDVAAMPCHAAAFITLRFVADAFHYCCRFVFTRHCR